MYLNELDTRYDDASRRTAKALRDYAEENNQAMLKVDPEGSMDYDLFLTVADAIEANDVDTVAKEISDADTDPRDFMMDLLLDNHPEMAKIVSMKVDNTIQSIFGMTGRMPESAQVNEGYEKTCLNALRQEGIGGYFSNGKLYVDFRDLDRAKEVIASDPDILEAPQIIGEEKVIEAKYEFGPATGKETYPGGYEHDARMITHIVTDLSPRLKDDEVMLDVQNAINRIETNTATKADITLVMDVYKDIVKQKLDKPYKDAIGKFDQDYDPNDPLQNVEEKAKPDYIDIDGDGNKKEPMKKAVKDKEKKEKVKEGKVKAMLMDMEDDASDMSREEFISKYGSHNADVWDDVNNPRDYPEPALNDFVKQDAESVDEGVQRNILYRDIGIMLAKGHDIKRIKKRYKDIDDAHPGHIEKVVQALKDRNEIPYGQYKRIKGADAVQEDIQDDRKYQSLEELRDKLVDIEAHVKRLGIMDGATEIQGKPVTGTGDINDQLTSMYKAVNNLQGAVSRALKIVPGEQNPDIKKFKKKLGEAMASKEEILALNQKWNTGKYYGGNGDYLLDGWCKYMLDSGIPWDACEKSEVNKYAEKHGDLGDFDMSQVEDNPDFPITNEFHNDLFRVFKGMPDEDETEEMCNILDQIGESKKIVKEMTSAENTVHKAFELAQSQINILERKFRPGGLIENKTKEIGGDASIFPEVQDKLADVYDVLEDAHYDAMGHVHNENISERTLTKAEKKKMKSYEKDIKKKDFIERYGKEKGESVYYATITKMAKKNA